MNGGAGFYLPKRTALLVNLMGSLSFVYFFYSFHFDVKAVCDLLFFFVFH